MISTDLNNAYQFCQQLAQSHYENFPVASKLLPKKLRQPISVIYAFARTADDFADEGDLNTQQRLTQLNHYSANLLAIDNHHYQGDEPIFIALADVIQQHHLPISLFEDLLTAFKQDVHKPRYQHFNEVLDYCRYSANPVGRLLLFLNGKPCEQQLQQSDAICTALQLINFYQDIEQDIREQDRIYLPLEELKQFGINEQQLLQAETDPLAPLLRHQYQRASTIMQSGIELGNSLNGRIGWEIRAMTLGGVTTLNKLIHQDDKQLLSRPRLSKQQLIMILMTSLSKRLYLRKARQLLAV